MKIACVNRLLIFLFSPFGQSNLNFFDMPSKTIPAEVKGEFVIKDGEAVFKETPSGNFIRVHIADSSTIHQLQNQFAASRPLSDQIQLSNEHQGERPL